jgi:hypothetical protein
MILIFSFEDTRRGTCWARIKTGKCEGEVHNNVTKADCCAAAVGRAWGSPCEECFGELVAAVALSTMLPISSGTLYCILLNKVNKSE